MTAVELPGDVRQSIEDGWRRARRVHGSLGLDLEKFTADIVTFVARSRARLDLPFDAVALREDVAGLHYEDLYLARLCDLGDERAWAAFLKRYEPDLRSVLLRDCDSAEAESVAAEVMSELALAPPRGTSRTRLGSYDGTGPLWAWLATIGIRAARSRWRKRREVPLEGVAERETPTASPAPDVDDQVQRFVGTLRAAWSHLEPPERLALAWKHRDRLAQREIARLLGVSEPTASRLVARGVAKLASHVSSLRAEGAAADAALWTRLEQALSAFLERSGAPRPLDVE